MDILFNKKQQKRLLVLGALNMIIGISSLFIGSENYFLTGFIGIGFFYVVTSIYNIQNPYIRIESEYIKKSGIFNKKVFLDEITEIKKFAGDYIVKTKNREIHFDTNMVDKESLKSFTDYFDQLISKEK